MPFVIHNGVFPQELEKLGALPTKLRGLGQADTWHQKLPKGIKLQSL